MDKQSKLNDSRSTCEERRQTLNKLHSSYEEKSIQFQSFADHRTPASIRVSLEDISVLLELSFIAINFNENQTLGTYNNFLLFNNQESLKAATLQADEESERVAEHFLSGGMNLDQFLEAYINKRMV